MRAEHRARRRLQGADTARQAKRSKTQTTKTRNEADPEAVDEIKPRQETVRVRLMPARARAKPRGSRRSRGDRDPEGRAWRPSRKRARDWEAPWETVTRERYQPLKQRLIPTSQNPQTGSGGTQNSPRHSPGAQIDTVQASRRGDGERRPGRGTLVRTAGSVPAPVHLAAPARRGEKGRARARRPRRRLATGRPLVEKAQGAEGGQAGGRRPQRRPGLLRPEHRAGSGRRPRAHRQGRAAGQPWLREREL